MNASVRILTSLRNAPSAPMSREELDELRAKAWRELGLIVMFPVEFTSDFVRQGAVNDASKKFGRRMKK